MKGKSELNKEIIKCENDFCLIYNTFDDNFYIQFLNCIISFPPTEITFLKITHEEAALIIFSENPCKILEKIYYKYCFLENYF